MSRKASQNTHVKPQGGWATTAGDHICQPRTGNWSYSNCRWRLKNLAWCFSSFHLQFWWTSMTLYTVLMPHDWIIAWCAGVRNKVDMLCYSEHRFFSGLLLDLKPIKLYLYVYIGIYYYWLKSLSHHLLCASTLVFFPCKTSEPFSGDYNFKLFVFLNP